MTTNTRLVGWLAAATIAISLTACSEKSDNDAPVSPTPQVPTGNKFTIAPTGGTVETGTLKMEIPSGTFTSGADVYVDEVSARSVRGEDEVSQFYKVTMRANTGKPVKVSIACSNTDDDIMFVARSKAYSISGGLTSEADMPLDFTYSNGVYTAEIPAFHNNQDDSAMGTITFGLAHSASAKPAAQARESQETRSQDDGKITFHFDWGSRAKALENTELQEIMESYLYEALGKIKELGCKVEGDRKIPIIITPSDKLDYAEYGRYEMSFWGRKWAYILINDGFIGFKQRFTKSVLRSTCIHELFHYFQADYDPRVAWTAGGIVDTSGEFLMIYESGGVWVEQFMHNGDFPLSFVAEPERGPHVMRGLTTVTGSTHANHGYGLSIFLEYMTQQYGKESIVKLLQAWKDKKASDALGLLKAWADALGCKVFASNMNFDQYLIEMSEGNVIPKFNFSLILSANSKTFKDDIKDVSTGGSVDYSGTVNSYGARYSIYEIKDYQNAGADGSMKGKSLTFTEKESFVSTYLFTYDRNNKSWNNLGLFNKNNPLVIEDADTLQSLLSTQSDVHYIYMLTVNDLQSEAGKSAVTVTLGDAVPKLSLSKTECSFTADGGEEQIVVTTNCTDVSVTEKPSWCSASISGNTLTLKAEKNTTAEKREGDVVVMARNGSGEVHATIKVAQGEKMSIGSNTEYKGVFLYYNLNYLGRDKNTYMQKIPLLQSNLVTPAACTMSGNDNTRIITASGNDRWVSTSWRSGYIEDEHGNPTIEIRDTIWAETNWTFQLTVDMDNAVITTGSVTQTFEQIHEHYMQSPVSRLKDTRSYSFINLPLTSIIYPVPYQDPDLWNPTRLIGHSFGVDSETGDMLSHITEATWVHTEDGVESTWTIDNLDLQDNWSFFIILTPKDDYVKPF